MQSLRFSDMEVIAFEDMVSWLKSRGDARTPKMIYDALSENVQYRKKIAQDFWKEKLQ